MKREDAIDYLEDKEKLNVPYKRVRKFSKSEETEIKKVMKKGKIYGDPLVILNE